MYSERAAFGRQFHDQMNIYRNQEKTISKNETHFFHTPGPVQASRGQVTSQNLDARHQMEKFRPEEISQKAANILSIHAAQSPQTQQLVEVLGIMLRRGQIFEQLAVNSDGEWDDEYVNSIQNPSSFAKSMANKNIPTIQTTGQLLEYIVGVKKNEKADLTDANRTSNTAWETVFIGPDYIEEMYSTTTMIRDFQYERLSNSFAQIFNSMCKF